MSETKIVLEIPVNDALKEKEKIRLIESLISAFKKADISDVKAVDSYYREKRALIEPLYFVLEIVIMGTPIITIISMAIWAYLRESGDIKSDSRKEINLRVGDLKLSIRGNMTKEEIVELVKKTIAHGD